MIVDVNLVASASESIRTVNENNPPTAANSLTDASEKKKQEHLMNVIADCVLKRPGYVGHNISTNTVKFWRKKLQAHFNDLKSFQNLVDSPEFSLYKKMALANFLHKKFNAISNRGTIRENKTVM
jgi:hypothetical protein